VTAPPPVVAPTAPATPTITTAAVQKAWTGAVEKFAAERPMEADTIRAVQFHACGADQIEVMLPTALEKKLYFLRSPRNLELLEQSLAEQLGSKLKLVFMVGDSRNAPVPAPVATAPTPAVPGKPAPPPPNMSQEQFLNDPVIQNALKIFEAKIVTPASR
jgi:DNA polymerase-3 subunit gamma/tau